VTFQFTHLAFRVCSLLTYTAFIFKDTEQAEAFITEFAEELYNPQILDCP